MDNFRPWGLTQEFFNNISSATDWNFLGCLSTEDRFIAGYNAVSELVGKSHFFQITNESHISTSQFHDKYMEKFSDNKSILENLIPADLLKLTELSLNIPFAQFKREYLTKLNNDSSESLIIDITCFPKRFFFPILKIVMEDPFFKNVIVTYSIPKEYSEKELSQDFDQTRPLTLFNGSYSDRPTETLTIFSIGFDGYHFEIPKESKLEVLFPYPFPPQANLKNWKSVQMLSKNSDRQMTPKRVSRYNVPEVFDTIKSLTNNGEIYSILAPYGPKTMSLAMALFAISDYPQTPPEVLYTQPKIYNPEYSIGIKEIDGAPQVYSYLVKVDGHNLYSKEGYYD